MGSSVTSSVGRMVKIAVGKEDGKIVTKYERYTEGDALEQSLGDDDAITEGLALGSFDGEDMGPSDREVLGDEVEIDEVLGDIDGASDGRSDRWYKRWIRKLSKELWMVQAIEGAIDGTSDGSRSILIE